MRGLMGNFATMPLADVVELLARRRTSGSLVCERGTVRKSVVVQEGNAVSAASNDPREYLGQLLINFGHINEDQLTKAFQTQEETKVRLGRVLVMVGLVQEQTIRDVLSIKIRETLLDCYLWDQGVFTLDELAGGPEREGLDASVPLGDIAREAEFRSTVWSAIRSQFPSGAAGLAVDAGKAKGVDSQSVDARIVDLARAGHTIDEIGLALHATDFHLYQRLYAMHRQGIVTALPVGASSPKEVGEAVNAAEILDRARAFLEQRKYAEAEVVAARACELAPQLEAARAVLGDAQRALLGQLREALTKEKKLPRARLAPHELKLLALSAQEKYLLSRCDGSRDLRTILQVSPIKELEALKAFKKFIDGGIVELR